MEEFIVFDNFKENKYILNDEGMQHFKRINKKEYEFVSKRRWNEVKDTMIFTKKDEASMIRFSFCKPDKYLSDNENAEIYEQNYDYYFRIKNKKIQNYIESKCDISNYLKDVNLANKFGLIGIGFVVAMAIIIPFFLQ